MPSTSTRIWLFAALYFAAYVPYAALTKAMSLGAFSGPALSGPAMLPLSLLASAVSMVVTFSLAGLWRHASRRQFGSLSLPVPTRWTLLAGLATAGIIITTTLAYALPGVSVSLMNLLMRGGVLVLAPVVDALTGRKVFWYSWGALGLGVIALLDLTTGVAMRLPWLAALDVGLYLLGYFVRLRVMSHVGKQSTDAARYRYFVEEQLVAAPAAFVLVFVLGGFGALFADRGPLAALASGMSEIWQHPEAWLLVVIGVFSQATGVFGGLVLLAPQEHSYCVPLNRSASILGGIMATVGLALFGIAEGPGRSEWVSAGLLVASVLLLWRGPLWRRRRGGT